jgi:hypothetical protein
MHATECRYFLAVKGDVSFWGSWFRVSALVRGAAFLYQIEVEEGLAAVGTVRGQPVVRVLGMGIIVWLTISSRQECQANENPHSRTRDKRCELA